MATAKAAKVRRQPNVWVENIKTIVYAGLIAIAYKLNQALVCRDLAFCHDEPRLIAANLKIRIGRIGGDGEATTELRTFCRHRRRDRGLLRGEPLYESARRFAPARRLVDIGRDHRVGVDAHLRKQGEAPG